MALQERMQVIDVGGVTTHVYCRRVQSRKPDDTTSEETPFIMVVTGSPGMTHFYIPFVDKLFDLNGGRSEVCVIGQAGHSPGVAKMTVDSLGRDWYTLEDQVEHKLTFLHDYVGRTKSLSLIGHSIGCHIILQMLDRLAEDRVERVILLFPTIERMSETPNGRKLGPLFTTFRTLFIAVCWLLSLLPVSVQTFLLNQRFNSSPDNQRTHFVQAVMNMNHTSWYNILCMANQEMTEVVKLPVTIIQSNLHKLVFYYGIRDPWNLPDLSENLQQLFPNADITLCSQGIEHDFVLKSANQMAKFCTDKLTK